MYFCLQFTAAAVCMAALVTVSSGAGDWDYDKHGPSHWSALYKQFCAEAKQSPIDLGLQQSQPNSQIKKFIVVQNATNATDIKLTLQNNGHSVVLTWPNDLSIRMGVNATSPTHTAVQMHWHWGSSNQKGSEHTVGSAASPAEGHLVFYSENYNSFSYAKDKHLGLAVLGVLYEISEKDNPLLKLIEPALSNASIVPTNGIASVSLSCLNYLDVMSSLFLPTNTDEFYRYEGSLTTPPCYESVLWTVYRQKVPISERQLNMFRRLQFSDGSPMVNNFRPPLPLNPASIGAAPRVLYRTFEEQTCKSAGASSITASSITTVPLAALATIAVATQLLTMAAASSSDF